MLGELDERSEVRGMGGGGDNIFKNHHPHHNLSPQNNFSEPHT